MELSPSQIWFVAGALLIITEAVLPGLVVVFVGLGAATVGFLLHEGVVSTLYEQLITFFISTTVYLFTLRLAVMKIYPSDTEKKNIDEIENVVGQRAKVIETIPAGGIGRIEFEDSTWPAKSNSEHDVPMGSEVVIKGRENLTWQVEVAKESEI